VSPGGSALDLAERALGHTSGEAQATVVRERSLLSRFARSKPTQATEVDDTTVSVLSVHDGHLASAETNDLSDAGLRDVAARAAAGARAAATAAGRHGEYPGLPAPAPARGHDGFDPATAALDPGLAGAGVCALL
jgi:PmbA protein